MSPKKKKSSRSRNARNKGSRNKNSRNKNSRAKKNARSRQQSAARRPTRPPAGSPGPRQGDTEPVVPAQVSVVEEPVVEEPAKDDPVVEEPVVAPVVPLATRTPRTHPTASAVGKVATVLVLMTASAIGLLALVHRGGSDTGSLASGRSFVSPTQVPAGASYVRTQVLAGGRLRVTHWIHSTGWEYLVSVGAPSGPGIPRGSLSVSNLVVAADGHRVPIPSPHIGRHAASLHIPPAHRIYLSYVLSGALERSEEPAGRALARVVSLDVTTQLGTTRTVHQVVGGRVLDLACTGLRADAVPRPCGTVDDGSWQVDLSGSDADDRVMAQLDLS